MSHSAEKCKRGDPLGTLKKIRKKISQRRKKIERGGLYETLVPSGLVCNVEKVNECAPRLPLAVQ